MSLIFNLLRSYKDNSGYYNTLKIMEKMDKESLYDKIKLFMIIGARRIGKTDLFLKLAIDNYFINNKTTFWIRNKDVELKEEEFYTNFLNDAFHLNMFPDFVDPSKIKIGKRGVSYEDNIFIKFHSINTFSNMRGAGHPNCNLMIFDEFIGEDRRYPKNCVKGLLSMTKTIFSGREDCYVFMLSNWVSVSNAYFSGFFVYPKDEITIYKDKAIIIETCKGYNCAITEKSSWNNLYKAGKYGDYEDGDDDNLNRFIVKKIPKFSEGHDYVIRVDEQNYRIYWNRDKQMYYWKKDQCRNSDTIYVTDILQMTNETKMIIPEILMLIKMTFENNNVRFESPNTLFTILNIMYNV